MNCFPSRFAFQRVHYLSRRHSLLGSKRATVAAKGMTRKPVDIKAAVRVVEELEAATMSVLMHGGAVCTH